MINGFPKLFALGSPDTKEVFDGEVEITEKIDGSQMSFAMIDDGKSVDVKMRSKSVEIFFENEGMSMACSNPMFTKGAEFVASIYKKLPVNYVFHGEYLQAPRHNTLAYGRAPKNWFMLFGITKPDRSLVCDYEDLEEWADKLGCEVVPLLYRGPGAGVKDADILLKMLRRESVLGGAQIEGFVIKNYAKTALIAGRILLPLLAAKYVSDQFKEKHVDGWKESNPSVLDRVGKAFSTTARWAKSVQHLRDEGRLTNTPKDIGALLKELERDIKDEALQEMKDMLWNLLEKDILRISKKGLPEWYKQELLKQATEA